MKVRNTVDDDSSSTIDRAHRQGGRVEETGIAPPVAAAAKWWADLLRGGEEHVPGGLDGFIVYKTLGGELEPLTKDQVNRYEAALARLVQQKFDDPDRLPNLRCEHFPLGPLKRAADEVGIKVDFRFPTKTDMHVRHNGVWITSTGRRPFRRIWPSGWGLLQLPRFVIHEQAAQRAIWGVAGPLWSRQLWRR